MIRKFEFTPILGWSVSRWDTFSACRRQYYYQYYTKVEGGRDRENFLTLKALKDLTSIPLEIGNVTHKIIEILLKRMQKTTKPIDMRRFDDFVRENTKRIVESKNFSEIYYEELEAIDPQVQILPKVSEALKNLLGGGRIEWLAEKAVESKDQWIIDPEGYGECRIGGQKAYCKVDFMFPVGDELHILDWKTGKKDDKKHGRQLRGYVTWAYFHFGVAAEKIVPTVAYLIPEYKERSIKVNEFDVEAFAEQIREETEEMYDYCEDIEQNTPLAKSEFPMTENLKLCSFCNFRELCGRR